MMPPRVSVTRCPETGEAEVFGSLGASGDLSGDLMAFRLAIVTQRGGAKTTEKLSARGDDSAADFVDDRTFPVFRI